jgi:hypothetical protein
MTWRTRAEDALLAKARRGAPITVEDKLSVIDSALDVDWFRAGLRDLGLQTAETDAACARRKVEIMRGAA